MHAFGCIFVAFHFDERTSLFTAGLAELVALTEQLAFSAGRTAKPVNAHLAEVAAGAFDLPKLGRREPL